jgi:hypothetical protein
MDQLAARARTTSVNSSRARNPPSPSQASSVHPARRGTAIPRHRMGASVRDRDPLTARRCPRRPRDLRLSAPCSSRGRSSAGPASPPVARSRSRRRRRFPGALRPCVCSLPPRVSRDRSTIAPRPHPSPTQVDVISSPPDSPLSRRRSGGRRRACAARRRGLGGLDPARPLSRRRAGAASRSTSRLDHAPGGALYA